MSHIVRYTIINNTVLYSNEALNITDMNGSSNITHELIAYSKYSSFSFKFPASKTLNNASALLLEI